MLASVGERSKKWVNMSRSVSRELSSTVGLLHRRLVKPSIHNSPIFPGLRECSPQYSVKSHIFTRDGVEEILNLQPRGSLAKAYQVKHVRNVIVQYRLAEEHDAE